MNALLRTLGVATAVALSLGTVACGPGAMSTPDASTSDAATTSDAGASGLPACVPDLDNQCVMEGCNFAPITLRSCDPGEPDVPFYGTNYCDYAATLVVIAAGWCGPCQAEAPMIESIVTRGYASRNVRVISVVVQKPDRSAADAAFCNTWRSRYNLTSVMAFDPRMSTSRYFPDMALPSNMIIDRHGVIRWRVYGTSTGLSDLRSALDEVLASDTGR